MSCPFCTLPPERIIAENDLCVAIRDAYPVSEGHTLVIPKRHVETWFEATAEEQAGLMALVDVVRRRLSGAQAMARSSTSSSNFGDQDFAEAPVHLNARRRTPNGYNIGINVGEAAGQTVMHLHVHVIPRYLGDVEDPTGGVRGVIPGKANYRKM
jgi:diadenosine tetraphosphate (Ap4A) HIT family hydrolase